MKDHRYPEEVRIDAQERQLRTLCSLPGNPQIYGLTWCLPTEQVIAVTSNGTYTVDKDGYFNKVA